MEAIRKDWRDFLYQIKTFSSAFGIREPAISGVVGRLLDENPVKAVLQGFPIVQEPDHNIVTMNGHDVAEMYTRFLEGDLLLLHTMSGATTEPPSQADIDLFAEIIGPTPQKAHAQLNKWVAQLRVNWGELDIEVGNKPLPVLVRSLLQQVEKNLAGYKTSKPRISLVFGSISSTPAADRILSATTSRKGCWALAPDGTSTQLYERFCASGEANDSMTTSHNFPLAMAMVAGLDTSSQFKVKLANRLEVEPKDLTLDVIFRDRVSRNKSHAWFARDMLSASSSYPLCSPKHPGLDDPPCRQCSSVAGIFSTEYIDISKNREAIPHCHCYAKPTLLETIADIMYSTDLDLFESVVKDPPPPPPNPKTSSSLMFILLGVFLLLLLAVGVGVKAMDQKSPPPPQKPNSRIVKKF